MTRGNVFKTNSKYNFKLREKETNKSICGDNNSISYKNETHKL